MLRLCPDHGLEKWLVIHTFYNGLLYVTKITIDAAAGGALMNKDYKIAYALIEEMAQNHCQWTNEETTFTTLPSKQKVSKDEIPPFYLLSNKVDTLSLKFDKLNDSTTLPTSTPSPCETGGIINHTSIKSQLDSTAESAEQIHFVQNNQGMMQKQNFHNNLQHPLGQAAPPSHTNAQRIAQKSSLEILVETYFSNQTNEHQELKNRTRLLNDSLAKLTSKVDSIISHNKVLETQISQMTQRTHQPKMNKMNAITLRNCRKLEDPIVKAKPSRDEKEGSEPQGEETKVEGEKQATPTPYKPKIPFPQRFAKSKLDGQFKKFIEMMNKLYIDVPFTEVLTQMPTYAKFLKEILSKKRKIEEDETVNLTEECSAIIQNKLPPKLKDPGSFSIPCVIGSEIVKKAMCDLGASVSLMPLSLFERMGIGELKSTRMTIQLADRSVKYPAGIVEDVPVKIGEIYIR